MQIFHHFFIQTIPYFKALHIIQQVRIRIRTVIVVNDAVGIIDFNVVIYPIA